MFTRLLAAFGVRRPTENEARAIAELQAYSDRDLADLGLARSEIADAVLHGRPSHDRLGTAANDSRRADHRAA
ncbi:MAG: DUF1127 domain-containing protein [Alphaproteobacteria bacterium]|jgi:uncharacterized protein YjiS (DUF1127 family)|nr:DUF1127 domain-containing protein [Alphaproteobacteria bacterium]